MATEEDVYASALQVRDEVGIAAAGSTQVDRPAQGLGQQRAPEGRSAQPRSGRATLRRQLPSAESPEVAGVQQLAGRELETRGRDVRLPRWRCEAQFDLRVTVAADAPREVD